MKYQYPTIAKKAVLLSALMAGMAWQAQAATLAYWRMGDETSLLTDSSGNGNNLTASTATEVNLPASGNGSTFSNPIPQNGFANTKAANFSGSQRQIAPDFVDASLGLTVEGYFNSTEAINSTQYIASQWNTSSQRSWAIGRAATGGTGSADPNELFMIGSGTGSDTAIIPLGFTIANNKDYYFAVSISNASASSDITVYFQNLTDGGSLQTNITSSGFTALNNSTALVEVGSYSTGNNYFTGLIDEVRLSSGVVPQSQLLISVPEPHTYALMAGLSCLLLAGLRRKQLGSATRE